MASASQPLNQPLSQPLPVPPLVTQPADGITAAASGDPIQTEFVPPEVPFFRDPWVQKALPLATSLILHLSIIIVGLTLFKYVPIVTKAIKDQIIVPDAAMVDNAPVGGVTNPGLGSDPNRAAAQDKVETSESSGMAEKKSESLTASLAGGGAADGAADNVIGLGAHAGIGSGGGVGAALGSGAGAGSGDSGSLSPFGVPGGGGGLGPKSPFMGISGNAHTIAYVCDASGSMLTKLPQLREQLSSAIGKLQPIQSFSVIFFADPDEKPNALSQQLLIANPDNKLRFEKFVKDVSPHGSTDPIPGLELAFTMHPQLLYLLTDGDFPDNKKVLDKITTLQAASSTKVKINTIVFTDPAKADKGVVELLKKISDDSGGQARVVSPDDL